MFLKRNNDATIGIVIASALALLMTLRLFYSGGWYALDLRYDGLIRLPYLLNEFKESFLAGNVYPRWLSRLYGGYGWPQFVFYQPGYFFFSLPFIFLFTRPEIAALVSLYAILWLSIIGMYFLARLFTNRLWSIACVLLFFISPKLALIIYHGASPHIYAMCWAIWTFYFLFKIAYAIASGKSYHSFLLGYTLCLAWTILSHPFVGAAAFMVLPLLTLGLFFESKRSYAFMAAITYGTITAIIITAGYWFPMYTLSDEIDHKAFHAIAVSQLLNRQSYVTALEAFIWGIPYDFMTYYITTPLHWLALIGLALSCKRPVFLGVLAAYLMLIFMQTRFSVFVWDHIPGLNNLQFPSRVHNILDITRIVAITQVMHITAFMSPKVVKALTYSIIALCMALMASFYSGYPASFVSALVCPPPLIVNYEKTKTLLESDHFASFSSQDELRPIKASHAGLINRLKMPVPVVQWRDNSPNSAMLKIQENASHIVISLLLKDTLPSPQSILINQFYFPGWVVRLNGEALVMEGPILHTDDNGRMLIDLKEAGNYEIEAFYDGPPNWLERNLVMMGLFTLFSAIYIYVSRRLSGIKSGARF